MQPTADKKFSIVATTLFGLEDVLSGELLKIGATEIEKHTRAVSYKGNLTVLYKSNMLLRTALRILIPLTKFPVLNEDDLYDKVKKLDWSRFLTANDTLAIDTTLNTEIFNHTQFISQKVKDAIVDQFREKLGKRPSVDLNRPTVKFHVHVFKNECSIALDSTGESLHKRGYREKTNLAPINEALAAGLILLTGWDKQSNFIDPMCGSGTLLIEAAMIASNMPPSYHRDDYGFMRWRMFLPFDEKLYKEIQRDAFSKIDKSKKIIFGGELSPHVARKAKENLKRASVSDIVNIRVCDIAEFKAPAAPGMVMVNPPYGERMDKENIDELYKKIGDAFKQRFNGYDCWIISSNMTALKKVGLKTSAKIPVFNGQLECRFAKYEMYAGSKKIKSNTND